MKAIAVPFDPLTRGWSWPPTRWIPRAISLVASALLVLVVSADALAADPVDAPRADGAPALVATATPAVSGDPTPVAPPQTEPSEAGAKVRLRERHVFSIHLPYAGKDPETRARAASQALERVLDGDTQSEPRVEQDGDVAVVYVGDVPIVQLTVADALAAGDSSLSVHAASVAAKVRDSLRIERKRANLAKTVFSFSLLVFSGLIAFLLLRKIGELSARAQAWIAQHPDRVPGLRVQELEVVRPRAASGVLSIAVTLGRTLAQVVIGYGWLVFALSLFETTKPYTDRLTTLVLGPLSELIGRVGSTLPLVVVTLIAAGAVGVLLRFIALFFAGIDRGDLRVTWLPAELAEPTSQLVRAGVIVVALVTGAPLVTGNDEGVFARAGLIALIAGGLACTPLLASVAAGIPVVYGRRLRVGEYVQIGSRQGKVRALTLFEVRLEDEHGNEVRIPHLLGLVQATRVLGRTPLASVRVAVAPDADQGRVLEVLTEAARSCGSRPKAEFLSMSSEGAEWRVSAALDAKTNPADLAVAVADALARERIVLGRAQPERAAG